MTVSKGSDKQSQLNELHDGLMSSCLRADVTVFTRLEVKQDGVLSLGRRATVFNAQLLQGQGSRPLVIKVLSFQGRWDSLDENEKRARMLRYVRREILAMKNLEGCENVAKLIGVHYQLNLEERKESILPGLVFEYYRHGNLRSYITSKRNSLSFKTKVKLLRDVAVGLNHIHCKNRPQINFWNDCKFGYCHRDIKGENILVGERLGQPFACIADFGSALIKDESMIACHQTGEWNIINSTDNVSHHWMPPEFVTGKTVSTKGADSHSDMWSFGCLCIEVATGEDPWGKSPPVKLITTRLSNSELPQYLNGALCRAKKQEQTGAVEASQHTPEMIFEDTILEILKYKPAERLSAEKAIEKLDNVLQACNEQK